MKTSNNTAADEMLGNGNIPHLRSPVVDEDDTSKWFPWFGPVLSVSFSDL